MASRLGGVAALLCAGSAVAAPTAEGAKEPPSRAPAPAAESPGAQQRTAAQADAFYGEGGEDGAAGVEAEARGPKLDLYGFVDFTYSHNVKSGQSPFNTFPHFGSFAVGNVNLYASGDLGGGFSSLLEVRFLYLPAGTLQEQPDGTTQRYDTTSADYAEFERPLRWGGIEIERAVLEYQVAPWLAFEAGQFLTPYGIWNVDHGTPTLIGVRRPYTIGEALFPERQTGLEAHGALHLDQTSFGYHVTLSNGRGPLDSHLDLDANKAVGGRLLLRNNSFGALTLGASLYYGKYTDRSTIYGRVQGVDPPLLDIQDPITVAFAESAQAADLRWEWRSLLLQAEVVRNERAYTDENRQVLVEGRELQPDYSRFGGYGLVGYRTPYFGVMPYVVGESYDFSGSTLFGRALASTVGVNVRPQANVVFKGQYFFALLGDANDHHIVRGALRRFDVQAAWSF